MNYTKKSFSVGAPGTDTYRDNWERTFRPQKICGEIGRGLKQSVLCVEPAGHLGAHRSEYRSSDGVVVWNTI